MGGFLLGAAAYHFAWGVFLSIFPSAAATWLGFENARFPEVTQGVGLVIAIYGIGCLIASAAPLKHWPIVLVGLLVMLASPVGFVSAASHGVMPWRTVWLVVANLVWCAPFALILRAAAQEFLSDIGADRQPRDRMMLKFMTQHGFSLFELSQLRPTLVVFLRHSGCVFCREALSDIAEQREAIEEAGAQIALVTMSAEPGAQAFFDGYGLGDVPRISDPDCELYRAFELQRGSWGVMFSPGVWLRGFVVGLLRGRGIGRIDGDTFRMPGVFLIHDGQVLRSYRHQSPADRPEYRELAACEECAPQPVLTEQSPVN